MFGEPKAQRAADKATVNSKGCQNEQRGLATPAEEVELALQINPRTNSQLRWIDPQLAAVYVIRGEGSDLCKIGYASKLRTRLLSIQSHSAMPVYLDHFVYVVGPLVAKRVEKTVHGLLDDYRNHGEWFAVPTGCAAAAIYETILKYRFVWWDERGRRDLGFEAARVHRMDWTKWGCRADLDALGAPRY